jgi:hypothetical protein
MMNDYFYVLFGFISYYPLFLYQNFSFTVVFFYLTEEEVVYVLQPIAILCCMCGNLMYQLSSMHYHTVLGSVVVCHNFNILTLNYYECTRTSLQ